MNITNVPPTDGPRHKFREQTGDVQSSQVSQQGNESTCVTVSTSLVSPSRGLGPHYPTLSRQHDSSFQGHPWRDLAEVCADFTPWGVLIPTISPAISTSSPTISVAPLVRRTQRNPSEEWLPCWAKARLTSLTVTCAQTREGEDGQERCKQRPTCLLTPASRPPPPVAALRIDFGELGPPNQYHHWGCACPPRNILGGTTGSVFSNPYHSYKLGPKVVRGLGVDPAAPFKKLMTNSGPKRMRLGQGGPYRGERWSPVFLQAPPRPGVAHAHADAQSYPHANGPMMSRCRAIVVCPISASGVGVAKCLGGHFATRSTSQSSPIYRIYRVPKNPRSFARSRAKVRRNPFLGRRNAPAAPNSGANHRENEIQQINQKPSHIIAK